MAGRGEDTSSGCSWIPATPAKPGSEKPKVICKNWNENQTFEADLLGSGRGDAVAEVNLKESRRSIGEFLAESTFRSVPAYTSSNSAGVSAGLLPWQAGGSVDSQLYGEILSNFDTWQAEKTGSSRVFGDDKLSINDPGQWDMSFSDLLALADAGANTTMSPGNSSAQNNCGGQGGRFHGELDSTPHTFWGGTLFPYGPSFERNSLDGSFKHATLSNMTPSQFEPITPDKTSNLECRQDSTAMLGFSQYTGNAAKQAQDRTITTENVNNQLCETMSGQLQENHKPDKEGIEETDLSKTPQQKSRRRKHRPKVIIEGKSKSTPKPGPETPLVPRENTAVKRKYVRRKNVNTNETDSNTKAATAKNSPASKKKCTAGKTIDKPEATTDKEATTTVEQMTGRSTRKSCRRALNFNSQYHVRDESSTCNPSSNCKMQSQVENVNGEDQVRTVESRQGKEIMEKNGTVITRGTTHSIDQELNNCQSMPKRSSQSSFSPEKADHTPNEICPADKNVSVKGKCQIVFSDATTDKEVDILQLKIDTWRQKEPNSSKGFISSSSLLTPDRQPRGLKRQVDTSEDAERYNRDATETLHCSIPSNHFVSSQITDSIDGSPGMISPTLSKRNRIETAVNTATNFQYNNMKIGRGIDSFAQLFPSSKQGPSSLQCQASNEITSNPNGTQDGGQVFKDLLALGPKEKVSKKKSTSPVGARGVSSLVDMTVSAAKDIKIFKRGRKVGQNKRQETLAADTCSPMMINGQWKERLNMNSIVTHAYNHLELPTTSNGRPLAIPWQHTSQIDLVVDQLNQLNLNAESRLVSAQNHDSLVAHHMHYQEQSAIVLYQRGGAVVPFDGSLDQIRRRKPRAKVDLDDETTRVWKLLLENINSEGIDGTDEENAKWWEEERRVFNGRADSFIARMHLVQGDRRFSPWKGSVVDSVVGVFLTQNVSDHLSSSAFMSLAARFPIKEKNVQAELHEASMGNKMKEPEVCMLDPEETCGSNKEILLELVCPGDTCTGDGDQISVVTGGDSIGNNADIIQKESLRCQMPDVSQCEPVLSHESASDKSTCLNNDRADTEEAISSQTSVISSQNSADSPIAQTEKTESSAPSHSGKGPQANLQAGRFNSSASFAKLLQLAGTVIHGVCRNCSDKEDSESQKVPLESLPMNSQSESTLNGSASALKANICSQSDICLGPNSGAEDAELPKKYGQCTDTSTVGSPTAETSGISAESNSATTMKFTAISSIGVKSSRPNEYSTNKDTIGTTPKMCGKQSGQEPSPDQLKRNKSKMQAIPEIEICPRNLMDVTGSSSNIDVLRKSELNEVNSSNGSVYYPGEKVNSSNTKGGKPGKDKQEPPVDWDGLRKQALKDGFKREKTANTTDSVDWDAVRHADVKEVADAVKERGMNNKLAERIKDFLDRIVTDHGSIDLEWLRDVPPDKAKEYLLSVRGLGLKSVECVRLLTLHQLAFPVDTNVGRIAVRLGWVPLQPLPESLQLHLLELYPVLESIQKYLWPRLCKLDQRTLYELHYQMITFGKVFCTKNKPNCNACPMKGECRHFASAFASARLGLPAPEDKSIVSAVENKSTGQNPVRAVNALQLPSPEVNQADVRSGVGKSLAIIEEPKSQGREDVESGASKSLPIIEEPKSQEPIIEEPASPEQDFTQTPEHDIEDAFYEDPDEIPTIQLNIEQFTQNLHKVLQQNTELQECNVSNALVALTAEAASIPVPKLKNVSQLRTEHQVYELPDSHPLLQGVQQREPDDPSPYLLAIWTPGETIDSINPPERRCSSEGSEILCTDETCLSCNSIRELNAKTVRGTLLIPCRTAMRGSFPLNGTYFQVNEVFSDHESSVEPINVPREWLWNLRRRIVYFGTSVPTIFKGLTTEQIQYCFWRGFVCVRGFDRTARAPRPLIARLHFPASKRAKAKGKTGEN